MLYIHSILYIYKNNHRKTMCMVCEEVVWCCVVTEWGESFSIYSDSEILIKFAEVFNYISLKLE